MYRPEQSRKLSCYTQYLEFSPRIIRLKSGINWCIGKNSDLLCKDFR